MATLVAWNMARLESAYAETASGDNLSYEWRLVCVEDPTVVGGIEGERGNNGADHPNRQWFLRDIATWDGGDDGVAFEIRGTGPVACAKDAMGAFFITDAEVRSSFTVSGSIKAYANNDANDGDSYWDGVFNDTQNNNDNHDHDKIAYDAAPFNDGTLSIDDQGDVTFTPTPLVFSPIQCAFREDWRDEPAWNPLAFQLVGGGGITPAMQVVGCVARANIDDVTWEIGFSASGGVTPGDQGGPGANIGLNFKLIFKNLPVATQGTLSWNFHKVRRWVKPDETKGTWEDKGLAWPSNFTLQNSHLPAPYKPSS